MRRLRAASWLLTFAAATSAVVVVLARCQLDLPEILQILNVSLWFPPTSSDKVKATQLVTVRHQVPLRNDDWFRSRRLSLISRPRFDDSLVLVQILSRFNFASTGSDFDELDFSTGTSCAN